MDESPNGITNGVTKKELIIESMDESPHGNKKESFVHATKFT